MSRECIQKVRSSGLVLLQLYEAPWPLEGSQSEAPWPHSVNKV